MSQDEVLGFHGKLLDVTNLGIELSPKLVRGHIIVLWDVEGFVEQKLVYRSCVVLFSMAFIA